jgi:hypothetical protein
MVEFVGLGFQPQTSAALQPEVPSYTPPPVDPAVAREAHAATMLAAAHYYVALGLQIVPLVIGQKKPAGGNEWNVPGVGPIATNDEIVDSIWGSGQQYWGCGVGLFCSFESNTLVLDIDVKNGAQGVKSLAEFQSRFGPVPATMRNLSANGGYHLIYRIPSEWKPAMGRTARYSINGMEVLLNRRQAVMAPTQLADGKQYALDYFDEAARLPRPVAYLDPTLIDALLYGKHLENDAERTDKWSHAHFSYLDIDCDQRNSMADQVIEALSVGITDNFGRAIVDHDVSKMRSAGPGTRYPMLKQLAMHLCLAIINDGAQIKLDDAMNQLVEAYRDAQLTTGEMTELEAKNALDTVRWAVTRPLVIEGITQLNNFRKWASRGETSLLETSTEEAIDAALSTQRAYRKRIAALRDKK